MGSQHRKGKWTQAPSLTWTLSPTDKHSQRKNSSSPVEYPWVDRPHLRADSVPNSRWPVQNELSAIIKLFCLFLSHMLCLGFFCFVNCTRPLLMYYRSWFCVFMGFLCVSMSVCVYCAFCLASSSCLLCILSYSGLFCFRCLVCFLMRARKGVNLGG